jgi:hypothetical protein
MLAFTFIVDKIYFDYSFAFKLSTQKIFIQGIQIFCGLLGLARMGLLLAYSGITRPEFQLSAISCRILNSLKQSFLYLQSVKRSALRTV